GIVELASGFFLSLDGSYTSASFSDTANGPSESEPSDNRNESYVLVNGKVGYRADRWAANVFVRNLFDEDYTLRVNRGSILAGGDGIGAATIGAPRVAGLEVTMSL
ncbi:MAG: hypothetical protein AAGE43_14090, partial [Pseudomonadota bacterium]